MGGTRSVACRGAALALLLLAAGGCGRGMYPVRGKVTFDDGTPVTKGLVVFESQGGEQRVTARGEIQPDGSYELSTAKHGDGVPAGKYRALVAPIGEDPDNPKPPPFDKRFADYETSGLSFEVKEGPNDIPITVTKAKKGPR